MSNVTHWMGPLFVASLVTFATVAPALAQSLPCSVPKDPAGNCDVTRTLLGSGAIAEVAYKRAGDAVTLKARGIDDEGGGILDAVMVQVVVRPNGFTRWHSRPGMSLVFMTAGRLTFYTSHGSKGCTEVIAGEGGVPGFVQLPDQVSTYINMDGSDAVILALVLKTEADPVFTTPADQPTHPSCPQGFNPD